MDLAAAPAEPETDPYPLADYFPDNRARLLDIAAFLDRMDRAGAVAGADAQLHAFRDAIRVLLDDGPERVRAIQLILSAPKTGAPSPHISSQEEVR